MRPSRIAAVVASIAILAACSGAGSGASLAQAGPETFPCCHEGFIHDCGTRATAEACVSTNDTTGCTKTATTCGAIAEDESSQPAPAKPSGSSSGGSSSGGSSSGASSSGGSSSGGSSSGSSATKKKTGDACKADAECDGGLCLAYEGGTTGFCSKACATATDCPANYSCELLSNGGTKACAPKGDKKVGETCMTQVDCASQLCVIKGTATVGYCTLTCNFTGECPTGWACNVVQGSSAKLCERP